MTFIISEDTALKAKLSGIKVSDAKNNVRDVGVWFGQPDLEIREQSYPYITIQLVDVSEDPTRAHRGVTKLGYTPDGVANPTDAPILTEYPIPMDLMYQINTYSRHPYHDRALITELMDNRIKVRFGWLEIPSESTVRRMDLLGYTKRDIAEQDKRLFVNVFTVRVSSELYPTQLAMLANTVSTVHTTYSTFYEQNVIIP